MIKGEKKSVVSMEFGRSGKGIVKSEQCGGVHVRPVWRCTCKTSVGVYM